METRDTVVISDAAKAYLALEAEETRLRHEQVVLAGRQYQIIERLEALEVFKASLCHEVATTLPMMYQQGGRYERTSRT